MSRNAYVSSAKIQAGTVVSIEDKNFATGEAVTFVYPNDASTLGKVVFASANELTVELGNSAWRLRPHAPSDGQVNAEMAGPGASYWTVQNAL